MPLDLTRLTVRDFIEYVGDEWFYIEFYTKDGELRTMTARLGVEKYKTGQDSYATELRKETNTQRNQVTAWEATNPIDEESGELKPGNKRYRTISLDNVITLRIRGEKMLRPS